MRSFFLRQPSKLDKIKSFRSVLTSISTIRYQRYHIRMVENKTEGWLRLHVKLWKWEKYKIYNSLFDLCFLSSFFSLALLVVRNLGKKKPTLTLNVPMSFGLFYACVSFWKELPVVTFLLTFLENNYVIIFDLIFINFLLVWRRWTPIFSRLCVKEGYLFPVTEIGVSGYRLYYFLQNVDGQLVLLWLTFWGL